MAYHRPRPGRRFRYSGRLCHCHRCGYDWQAIGERRPPRCASHRCRSVYWDTPIGVELAEDDVGEVLAPDEDDAGREDER